LAQAVDEFLFLGDEIFKTQAIANGHAGGRTLQ
jgi:hypothetical protein